MAVEQSLDAAASAAARARDLIAEFAGRRPLRAGSFIVTLYGDAIVPRGGLVWLGNVIEACGQVGISETLVRTAVSRLVSAGHLLGVREGRRSYYRLTPDSLKAFEAAAKIIYGAPMKREDDRWSLLALPAGSPDEAARKTLRASGYGLIAPGLAARPAAQRSGTEGAPPLEGIAFEARLRDKQDAKRLRQQAVEAWALDDLGQRYDAFVGQFAPLKRAFEEPGATGLDDGLSLPARLILVQEYRHIVLKDPRLPSTLLPKDWPGSRAQQVFASLYRSLTAAADRAIDASFVNADGPLRLDPEALSERLARLSETGL